MFCGRSVMASDNLPVSIESMIKSAFEYELRNVIKLDNTLPLEEWQVIEQYFQARIQEMSEHLRQ